MTNTNHKERCNWPNLEKSERYREYHDNEWGVESHDDRYLFEMFILESFHCGLSWLIILNKREEFKKVYDNFEVCKVAAYNEIKISELLENAGIVRSKGKILASISNAQSFIKVQKEYGSFDKYIWSFTDGKVLYNPTNLVSTNELSDIVSKDLKKRGFKFMGSVTAYSYLEAIGVMNNHKKKCFKCSK